MRRYRARCVSAARASAQTEFISQAFGQKPSGVDANHYELVAHAEALGGYFVRVGPLDGWCFVPRLNAQWHPVEIKIPNREGLGSEYTPQQKRFMRWCREHGATWWIWRDKFDVEEYLGARRSA